MLLSPGRAARLLRASLLGAGALAASGALAQDRCSGTLCDFYYGGSAPNPAQTPAPAQTPDPAQTLGANQAAPTPLTVPTGGILGFFASPPPAAPGAPAPPPTSPMIAIGGGGLAAMARGEPDQRCTGTLCDFYYGGPPPETPPDSPAAQPTEASTDPAAANDATRSVERDPNMPAGGVRYAPPRCAAPASDPWRCYR